MSPRARLAAAWAVYSDSTVSLLDKQSGSEKGFTSFLANVFVIRGSNAPDAIAPMKEGTISYTRRPADTFVQFAWFALRSGVLDVIRKVTRGRGGSDRRAARAEKRKAWRWENRPLFSLPRARVAWTAPIRTT